MRLNDNEVHILYSPNVWLQRASLPRCKCLVEVWYSHATPGLLLVKIRACAGRSSRGWKVEVRKGSRRAETNSATTTFQRPCRTRARVAHVCLPLPINRLPHRHCQIAITANQSCVASSAILLIEPVSRPTRHHASSEEHRFKSPRGWRRAWTSDHKGQQRERWPRC